ncbi:hypothetical protein LMG28614_02265 [Paraburkholderia ultramafica]|uniref:Nickel/cobalt efflux system n=2 Tax=Paraburkholderia ultramafica TaxID=1544867 RepID=A0A6S7B5J0_9BURK|nr:hypothetical protein LMG28614_02265 [Paraburkholderia ultramafica]
MAAFTVAIRGTVRQAILLGVAATISHAALVWLILLGGQYVRGSWNTEPDEPYFQIASAAVMVGVALWIIWRTWRQRCVAIASGHDHSHDRDLRHHDETRFIDTWYAMVRLEVFENGVPPRFRLYSEGRRPRAWPADQVRIETQHWWETTNLP